MSIADEELRGWIELLKLVSTDVIQLKIKYAILQAKFELLVEGKGKVVIDLGQVKV